MTIRWADGTTTKFKKSTGDSSDLCTDALCGNWLKSGDRTSRQYTNIGNLNAILHLFWINSHCYQ